MGRRLAVVLVLLLACLPETAAGQVLDCIAPPGTAATDQYCEQVRPPAGENAAGGPVFRPPVTRATVNRLAATRRGQALAASTGPYRYAPPYRAATDRITGTATANGAFSAIVAAVSDAVTLGPGILWAGLAILLAMSTWYGLRRRHAP